MAWARLDDRMPFNRKIMKAGNAGTGVWARCVAWACGQDDMSGIVPSEILTVFDPGGLDVEAAVTAGLLHRTDDGGVAVHDFGDFNPSKEDLAQRRRTRSDAGRMGGIKSGQVRAARAKQNEANRALLREATGLASSSTAPPATNGDAHPKQRSKPEATNPVPVPVPVPVDLKGASVSQTDLFKKPDSPASAHDRGELRSPAGGGEGDRQPVPKKERRRVALDLLKELDVARSEVIPKARPTKPTAANLKGIMARLAEGHTVEDVRHVIAVRKAEVAAQPAHKVGTDDDVGQWFNAVTPFRGQNFERTLARQTPTKPRRGGVAPVGNWKGTADGDM